MVVDGAIVLPFNGRPIHPTVFKDGVVVPESLLDPDLVPGGDLALDAQPAPRAQRRSAETVVYAGYLIGHFGHFLLESLSRLWVTREFPDLPIVWSGPMRHYTSWQEDVLRLLGITNTPVFLEEPVEFATVIVPEPGYVVPRRFHEWHAKFLAVLEPAPTAPGRRIWVSRSSLPRTRHHVVNEQELEQILASHGWEILHPQKHAIRDQLSALSSAEVLAGFGGSAFHSLILLTDIAAEITLFTTRGTIVNFEIIASRKGFDQRLIALESTPYRPGKRPSEQAFILPNLSTIREALGIPLSPSQFDTSTNGTDGGDLVARLAPAVGAASYLELGGVSPTPAGLELERKVAVSKQFAFDTRSSTDERLTYFELEPVEYLTHFGRHERFDLISLRSPGDLDEMLRWFCGSLSLSTARTVWAIETTDQAGQDEYRARFALLLAEFFATFDYCTIEAGKQTWTLAWQAPRTMTPPPSGATLATISAGSRIKDVMNWCTHEEAFAALAEHVAGNPAR